MKDSSKTKAQLIEELTELRIKLSELEEPGSRHGRTIDPQIEEAYKNQVERYQSILENSPTIIFLKDLESRYLFINRQWEEVFQVKKEDVVGKTDHEIFSKEVGQVFRLNDLKVIEANAPINFEEVVPHDDGLHTYLSTKFPLYDVSGKIESICGIAMDITERKLIEEALNDSEIKYRTLFESSSDAVIMLADGKAFTECNGALLKVLGCSSKDQFIGKSPLDFSPEFQPGGARSAELIQEYIATARREGSNCFEFIHTRLDGTEFNAEVWLTAIDIRGEKIIQAVVRDITERKLAEGALIKSEAKLKKAQEVAHLGSWELDLLKNNLYWSDEIYRIFEIDPEKCDVTYETFLNSVHPDDRDLVSKAYTDSVANLTAYNIEHRILTKDGSVKYVQERCQTCYADDGTPLRSVGTALDITERKLAEEALKVSEERYHALSMAAFEGIAFTKEGVIYDCNEQLADIIGYSRDELIGLSGLNFVHLDDVEHARQSVLSGSEELYVLRLLHKDGSIRDAEVHPQMMIVKGEKLRVTTVHDITEYLKAKQEIIRLNESLECQVVDRTSELHAVNQELKAFAYSVSHDLRAPLRSIDGFSQVLLEDYGDSMEEDAQDYLRRIHSASLHMIELINDMLSLSKVTSSELRRESVDMTVLVDKVVKHLEKTVPERNVEMIVASGVTLEGVDSNMVRMIFENLIGNAWKFTSKKDSARIEFGEVEKNGERVFFVRDNGAGFDMAYADKLFSAFQRLHSVQEFDGTGVGLATVQRIVSRHGGRVWGEGETGVGAIFYFTLG